MEVRLNPTAIKEVLENDRRDVKDLWIDAIREYEKVLGSDAQDLKTTRFKNVDDMINFGNDQINVFSKWRHDDSRLNKIRSLFRANIDLIEKGTEKIIAAATPAFPPASIISTALTFVLAGCKSVSADFDVVTAFLEEMKSFLFRAKILERRLPTSREYQTSLTDVFTSLLKMCAFATKFIKNGRFKKWVVNAFLGEDSDLAGARANVQKSLDKLKLATEFAILANTEESREMDIELKENSKSHTVLLQRQQSMLESVSQQQHEAQKDLSIIKTILLEQKSQQLEKAPEKEPSKQIKKARGIRTIIAENSDNTAEFEMLRETRLSQTCEWLFEEDAWQSWSRTEDSTAPLLLNLHGPPGIGKTYLTVAAYDRLYRLTTHDPRRKICVTYFFCRRDTKALASFQKMLNSTILQISDQNILVHEQLNAELARDDEIDEKDYFSKLLAPMFRQGSNHMLYIIVDGVDEFETQNDTTLFTTMLRDIENENLNIRVLTTGRGVLPTIASTEILVDKSKIEIDLTKIIEDRLNSTDSAFQGIRRLNTRVKEEIKRQLKAKADGMLYADIALRYFANIGREGAIIRKLKDSLPDTAIGFLQKDVDHCWKRTPNSLVKAVEILLAWLVFGFHPLTLNGANALVRMYAGDQEISIDDEIEGIYGRIIQIAPATRSANETETSPAQTHNFDLSNTMSFDDRDFMITFRYRATKELLSAQHSRRNGFNSCLPKSAAHLAMFLLCFQLIQEHHEGLYDVSANTGYQELYDYAIKNCLLHWQNIDCEQQTEAENILVLESFAVLLKDRHYLAAQIEAMGYEHSIKQLVFIPDDNDGDSWSRRFLDDWTTWSRWYVNYLESPRYQLKPIVAIGAHEYWASRRDECALVLVKAHVDNWLSATTDVEAHTSYYHARMASEMTSLREKLSSEFPGSARRYGEFDEKPRDEELMEEIYEIRQVSDSAIDSNTCWATALIIRACGFVESHQFMDEVDRAINTCTDRILQFRNRLLKLQYYRHKGEQCKEEAGDLLQTILSQRDGVPTELIATALYQFTKVFPFSERGLAMFEAIRDLDAFFVPGNILSDEFDVRRYYRIVNNRDPADLLTYFAKLKQVQQLTLLAEDWLDGESLVHSDLLSAATLAGDVDRLIHIYDQVVRALDEQSSGAAWRRYLAYLHYSFKRDDETAKTILATALDTSYSTRQFELFKLDISLVATQIVNFMSTIIYGQFREATNIETKYKLLEQARALLRQNLPQSVQLNRASSIPHLLLVANMIRKIGSPEEWQKCMQQVFDITWDTLHDTVDWNDHTNLRYLSRILAQMPGLNRDAQIANSAQYYLFDRVSNLQRHLEICRRSRLYDSGSDIRFQVWVDNQPKPWIYVRDGETVWDYQKNNWSITIREGLSKTADQAEEVDFDNPEGAGVDLGDGRRHHYSWTINSEYYHTVQKEFEENFSQHLDTEEFWFHVLNHETRGWSLSHLKGIISSVECAGCRTSIHADGGGLDHSFTCLLCADAVLCQYCHRRRLDINKGTEPDVGVRFCCDGGQYLKGPVAKWQGIRDGKIFIRGEEPMEWTDFLQNVKTRWDQAWIEFWRG